MFLIELIIYWIFSRLKWSNLSGSVGSDKVEVDLLSWVRQLIVVSDESILLACQPELKVLVAEFASQELSEQFTAVWTNKIQTHDRLLGYCLDVLIAALRILSVRPFVCLFVRRLHWFKWKRRK